VCYFTASLIKNIFEQYKTYNRKSGNVKTVEWFCVLVVL
jgi:hypothetical protein